MQRMYEACMLHRRVIVRVLRSVWVVEIAMHTTECSSIVRWKAEHESMYYMYMSEWVSSSVSVWCLSVCTNRSL